MSTDLEKQSQNYANVHIGSNSANGDLSSSQDIDDTVIDPEDPGEAQVVKIRQHNRFLRSLRTFETGLDRKMKFEAMGVERIPEDKRRPPQILNVSAL